MFHFPKSQQRLELSIRRGCDSCLRDEILSITIRRRIFYCTQPYFHSTCGAFFLLQDSFFYSFFPVGRTPFSQFLQEGLLGTNSFLFPLCENVLIPISFLSDSFTSYWICNGHKKNKVLPASGFHGFGQEICCPSNCCFLQVMPHFWWQPSRFFCLEFSKNYLGCVFPHSCLCVCVGGVHPIWGLLIFLNL